jgi:hypothetical protein
MKGGSKQLKERIDFIIKNQNKTRSDPKSKMLSDALMFISTYDDSSDMYTTLSDKSLKIKLLQALRSIGEQEGPVSMAFPAITNIKRHISGARKEYTYNPLMSPAMLARMDSASSELPNPPVLRRGVTTTYKKRSSSKTRRFSRAKSI